MDKKKLEIINYSNEPSKSYGYKDVNKMKAAKKT